MRVRVYYPTIRTCPLGCRVTSVVAEEKMRVRRMIATYCTCSHRRCARTIRRGDRGHALPLSGLPPRHSVFSLALGLPVDSIATECVPSAHLSSDAPRPCDSKAGTV